jgi:hypothetical protein
MEQHVFMLSLIVEGTTEKVSKFIMPHKSIDSKKFCLKEQNVFLNYTERLKQQKCLYSCIINVSKICSVYLFCAALFELMFVIHKGALFHFKQITLSSIWETTLSLVSMQKCYPWRYKDRKFKRQTDGKFR